MSRPTTEYKPFTLQPFSGTVGEYSSPQAPTEYTTWSKVIPGPSPKGGPAPPGSPKRELAPPSPEDVKVTYKLLLDLPYRETMTLCNTSSYNMEVCSQESFWIEKANKQFGITADEFRQPGGVPTELDPSQRYLEILSENDVDIGSERFLSLDVCLARAVKKDDRNLIEYFIAKGAKNWDDGAAISARQGNTELAKYFLDLGATNLNRTLKGAIMADDLDLVMTILERGASAGAGAGASAGASAGGEPIDINSALVWSVLANNSRMINLFLERGATDMDTALIMASALGNNDLVKLFIDRRAIYLSDAANVAEQAGHLETAKLIRS